VGGLATAIRLAAAGHDVLVLERLAVAGGRLATLSEAGFTFDVGPSVVHAPHLLDEVFQAAGTRLADHVELIRLDPAARYEWRDGSTFEPPGNPAADAAAVVDAFSPGSGAAWQAFAARAGALWAAAEPTLLAEPAPAPGPLARALRRPAVPGRVDAERTLAKLAEASFDDPRLRQLVGHLATAAGTTASRAPATLALLAHAELEWGAWHVRGGVAGPAGIGVALARVARQLGVDIRTGADVGRVLTANGAVRGIELADGGVEAADVVVAGVDAMHLYRDLLPLPKVVAAMEARPRSASAFVICVAVRGRTEAVAHRNVWFPLDERQEQRYVEARQVPPDPTIEACVATVSDASMAPADHESWVIRVAVPPATGIDRKIMTAGILNRLAERGVDLRHRIAFTRTLVPADFEARWRAVDGTLHGVAPAAKQPGFGRPANAGELDGLYLVGGTAQPGPGVLFTLAGARIAAGMIASNA